MPSSKSIADDVTLPAEARLRVAIINGSLNGEAETEGLLSRVSTVDQADPFQYEKSSCPFTSSKKTERILPSPALADATVEESVIVLTLASADQLEPFQYEYRAFVSSL